MRVIEELRAVIAGTEGWRRRGEASRDLRRQIVGVDGRTVALCSRPAWADAALAAVSALPALLDVAEAARRYADDSEDAEAYALLRHALARLEEVGEPSSTEGSR